MKKMKTYVRTLPLVIASENRRDLCATKVHDAARRPARG